MNIPYRTRDANGNPFVKDVEIKEFPVYEGTFDCPVCKRQVASGCRTKDIVSANFTDWAYVGENVCADCAKFFSLYFYNYIAGNGGIRLLNVRELRDQLTVEQNPPFLFVITTSQKKHLFYRAVWNQSANPFAVNLETETIYTTTGRMRELFDFVECLQTLGAPKNVLANGEIPFRILQRYGFKMLNKLNKELNRSREIQIPLYCGQKREITEDDAICCINSTLTA